MRVTVPVCGPVAISFSHGPDVPASLRPQKIDTSGAEDPGSVSSAAMVAEVAVMLPAGMVVMTGGVGGGWAAWK